MFYPPGVCGEIQCRYIIPDVAEIGEISTPKLWFIDSIDPVPLTALTLNTTL